MQNNEIFCQTQVEKKNKKKGNGLIINFQENTSK